MELLILNKNLEWIGTFDAFESLIWTDRFFEAGEFELTTIPSLQNVLLGLNGFIAILQESDHFMVIEEMNLLTDPVDGNRLILKGRAGEVFLERRIIWEAIKFQTEYLQDAIFSLINGNILNPLDPSRTINTIEFEESIDPRIIDITTSNEYWGQTIYDAVVDLCVSNGVGFKLVLTSEDTYKFSLYMGQDRSYDQIENSYVVFSPDFENLKNSTFIQTNKLLRNVSLVAGEKEEGNVQESVEVRIDESVGIDRREMFLDAQDVSRLDPNGDPISDKDYKAQLYQRGREELSKNDVIRSFGNEVDPYGTFVYNRDFFIGDFVQVSNEYGIEDCCRIIEVTHSQDQTGLKIYPIFAKVPARQRIDESVDLRKHLAITVPRNMYGRVLLGKKIGLDHGINEQIKLEKLNETSTSEHFN